MLDRGHMEPLQQGIRVGRRVCGTAKPLHGRRGARVLGEALRLSMRWWFVWAQEAGPRRRIKARTVTERGDPPIQVPCPLALVTPVAGDRTLHCRVSEDWYERRDCDRRSACQSVANVARGGEQQ